MKRIILDWDEATIKVSGIWYCCSYDVSECATYCRLLLHFDPSGFVCSVRLSS